MNASDILTGVVCHLEDLLTNPPDDWLIEDHHTQVAVRKELLFLYKQLIHVSV